MSYVVFDGFGYGLFGFWCFRLLIAGRVGRVGWRDPGGRGSLAILLVVVAIRQPVRNTVHVGFHSQRGAVAHGRSAGGRLSAASRDGRLTTKQPPTVLVGRRGRPVPIGIQGGRRGGRGGRGGGGGGGGGAGGRGRGPRGRAGPGGAGALR